MIHNVVQLYLKAPRPGTVKTRLASTIGESRAAAVYRQLVERQLYALPRGWSLEVHFAPADAEEELREWLGNLEFVPQADGDLGERLSRGVAEAFQRGVELVFCIGADCPGLKAVHFQQAREFLETGADAVFGPAEDGGYYLLGQKRHHPCLFTDIPWSTDQTLRASLGNAKENGLRTARLPKLYDVDGEADWRRAVEEGLMEG